MTDWNRSLLIGIKDTAALLGWSVSTVRKKCIEHRHPDSRLRPIAKNSPWLWNLDSVWDFAEEIVRENWTAQQIIYENILSAKSEEE